MLLFKVEKILKGSLDSILSPSPSVKIQIMDGKSCLRCKRWNIAGCCQQTFENKMFVDNTQQFFAFMSQANFPKIFFTLQRIVAEIEYHMPYVQQLSFYLINS